MRYFVSFPTHDGGTIAVSMHDIRRIEGHKGEFTAITVHGYGEGAADETFHTKLSVEAVITKITKQAASYERMLARQAPASDS